MGRDGQGGFRGDCGQRCCQRLLTLIVRLATAAGKTDTFLGERYRRIGRRRGKKKALVAVGRSLLVVIRHLLSPPGTRFHDLGSGYYDSRIDPEQRKHNHVRQREALGSTVALQPTTQPPTALHPSAHTLVGR
ncbi:MULTISPECIES: hypothetical protein [unclassified Streptomyces]|uniref:hypothetical protein n=1 Tax=unclassified Streptomyces TaxID=2593676 RepID=UPI00224D2806|nr:MULTISPECIES: hypothetical protein [unclassified Streptomyces]MCX5055923.1 hypothetical protein [Streptomyces sp. NBC_00452]MCX5287016.1 hypothetical protein [Streptomyces sp. NBC_00183]